MGDTAAMLLLCAMLLLAVIAIVVVIVAAYAQVPLEKKYDGAGGGVGASFDAVWMPSAHEAGLERDRQTARTAPAPSLGEPPDAIHGEHIVIDV